MRRMTLSGCIAKIDYCLNLDVFSFQIASLVCKIGKDLGVTTSCQLKMIERDWFLSRVFEKTTAPLAPAPIYMKMGDPR